MKRLVFALAASLLWLAVVAMAPPGVHLVTGPRLPLVTLDDPTPTPTPTPTATPTPTPTPAGPPQSPSINLSSSSGPAGTQLIVSGTDFTPGSQVEVFADTPNRPMGPTITAGQDGSFQQEVAIPDGEGPGTHNICATAQVSPVCAQFTVLAGVPATPTPTAVPTPTPTPTPTATATATPATTISDRPQASKSALSTLFPWILIPILALLLIGAAALYTIVRGRSQGGPPARPARPTAGTGIPVVTHLSPKSGASTAAAEDDYSSLPPEDYSTLPPPEGYQPPQIPNWGESEPQAPETPATLPPPEGYQPPQIPNWEDPQAPEPEIPETPATLPPPENYRSPQIPSWEDPQAPEPPTMLPPEGAQPPATLPGPRPQLPGAGIDPPRAAGGDDDVDRPEPSD